MLQTLKKLYRDESGDALQYLVVAGVMILAFVLIWQVTGPKVDAKFNELNTELDRSTMRS